MQIVFAGVSEKGVFAGLHARCFAQAWSADSFEGLLASDNVAGLLARSNDGLDCGFAVVRIAADEAELLTIGVLPEKRRCGLAKGLMRSAMRAAFARGARTLFLEVAASNAAALGLYGSLGFEESGLRKAYYRNC